MTTTGHAAINAAETLGLTLHKHADPTEGARDGLTVEEAREIAREDASLIWIDAPAETAKDPEPGDIESDARGWYYRDRQLYRRGPHATRQAAYDASMEDIGEAATEPAE